MRRLSLGAAGLSLTIIAGAVAPASRPGPLAVLSPLVTLASALLFYLAFSPPAGLRTVERNPEQQTLRDAMNDLMAVTRVEEVAESVLFRVISIVAARGAALIDACGVVLGSLGDTPGLADGATDIGVTSAEVEAVAGGDTPVRLPLSQGAILVWMGQYAPFYTRHELDLLQALGTLADLALERVRAAERDAELAAVVDASGDAIASINLDGIVKSWNSGAKAIYGRSAAEIVGRPLTVLVPRDGVDELSGLIAQAGGERVELETRHLGRGGAAIDVALSMSPVRDRAGKVAGISVMARDITGSKQARRALEDARDAADQANQAKSEFLSRMSHELRTPLNAILGFAQLLEMDELTEEQRENLRYIISGGRHLLALINEVLDIAAIEAGRLPLSVEPIAVADLAGEAVDLIRPLADQNAILLSSTAQSRTEHVLADRQRLKQILLNLLSNAVKYNREGGSVRLSCEPVDGDRLRIEVADTGHGIAPESLERLFVPFERLEADPSKVEGTGLGLALSRRLAEAMGGTLEVTTVVGHGSTFWIELPVADHPVMADDPGLGSATPEDRTADDSKALTVLYIEDNVSNMELVERIMNRRGVRLIPAMRPLLGLDLAGEHRPDLILLDLHLPDIPGEEVLRRLRANPRTAGIPVVVLSADARPGHIRDLLEMGAREFLTKPLEVDQLLRILDEVSKERRPVVGTASA
jgi:PAS domain S-box-containing protein